MISKGKVIILSETYDEPITMMGYYSGICYNSNVKDHTKNFARGLDCIKSQHMRVAEFPKIYMELSGWSAKVIREFYTHIIDTTRLQSSTRYINYNTFNYVTPPSIKNNSAALEIYNKEMDNIKKAMVKLAELNIPKEDLSGLLPLNYETKIVCCMGLREFINMCGQRCCNRAYHEFRELMNEIINALAFYSDEWSLLKDMGLFKPKCYQLGYCPEKNGCGKFKGKGE